MSKALNRIQINRHFPRFGHEYHPVVAAKRRAELQQQTAEYLARGGKIQQVANGVSGLKN